MRRNTWKITMPVFKMDLPIFIALGPPDSIGPAGGRFADPPRHGQAECERNVGPILLPLRLRPLLGERVDPSADAANARLQCAGDHGHSDLADNHHEQTGLAQLDWLESGFRLGLYPHGVQPQA